MALPILCICTCVHEQGFFGCPHFVILTAILTHLSDGCCSLSWDSEISSRRTEKCAPCFCCAFAIWVCEGSSQLAIGIKELNAYLLCSVELTGVSPASELTLSVHRNHKLDNTRWPFAGFILPWGLHHLRQCWDRFFQGNISVRVGLRPCNRRLLRWEMPKAKSVGGGREIGILIWGERSRC